MTKVYVRIKRLVCAMLALALCMLICTPAFADGLDLTRKSSITIDLRDPQTGAALSGGWLYIYRVADVDLSTDEGFKPVERFDKGFDFSDIRSRDLVRAIYNYIRDNSYKCDAYADIAAGRAAFSDLTPGLYVILQAGAIPGYYPMNPFLVSIPMRFNGEYIYDINATPKMELNKLPTPPPPTTPDPDPEPDDPDNIPELPPEDPTEAGNSGDLLPDDYVVFAPDTINGAQGDTQKRTMQIVGIVLVCVSAAAIAVIILVGKKQNKER